jgi:catalase-peroxidase
MLIDKSTVLDRYVYQMTVLLGGMRVLNTNFDQSHHGVFTQRQVLTNDFFLNLLDMTTTWKSVSEADTIFEGHNRTTGELKALVLV